MSRQLVWSRNAASRVGPHIVLSCSQLPGKGYESGRLIVLQDVEFVWCVLGSTLVFCDVFVMLLMMMNVHYVC